MDEKLASQIQNALTHADDTVTALANALSRTSAPMTVRNARDSLSEVLHRAKDGGLQLIGKDKAPGDMALVLSVETFVEILLKAGKPLSFRDALYATGFRPATGIKPKLRRPNPRNPLKAVTSTPMARM